jgi:hypothetical protein
MAQAITKILFPNLEVGIETLYQLEERLSFSNRNGKKVATSADYHARLLMIDDGQAYRVDTTPPVRGVQNLARDLVAQINSLFKKTPQSSDYIQHQSEMPPELPHVVEKVKVPDLEPVEDKLTAQQRWQELELLENKLSQFIVGLFEDPKMKATLDKRKDPMFQLDQNLWWLIQHKERVTPEQVTTIRKTLSELSTTFQHLQKARQELERKREKFLQNGGSTRNNFKGLDPQLDEEARFFEIYPEYTMANLTTFFNVVQEALGYLPR